MENDLYKNIFKRKSFHLFGKLNGNISSDELAEINSFIKGVDHLYSDIKVSLDLVPSSEIKRGRGEEYAIIFYSEKKDNYLMNIGYIGEQIDLFLVSKDIGTLWYGLGSPNKSKKDGLDYIIMILIGKKDVSEFRKDMYASKRKELSEIWNGNEYSFANIIRYAPSACNTQNWFVNSEPNELSVFRQKHVKRGIIPENKIAFFNRIDIGIFLCFLELNLDHENIHYKRELFLDSGEANNTLVAKYLLQ